jgi:hypothetical protein
MSFIFLCIQQMKKLQFIEQVRKVVLFFTRLNRRVRQFQSQTKFENLMYLKARSLDVSCEYFSARICIMRTFFTLFTSFRYYHKQMFSALKIVKYRAFK